MITRMVVNGIRSWFNIFRRQKTMYRVMRDDGSSAVVRGDAAVQYTKGRWSYPPQWLEKFGYGLTCFPSLISALNFALDEAQTYKIMEIWEVRAVGVRSPQLPFAMVHPLTLGELRPIDDGWPPSTMMADAIKPINRRKTIQKSSLTDWVRMPYNWYPQKNAVGCHHSGKAIEREG